MECETGNLIGVLNSWLVEHLHTFCLVDYSPLPLLDDMYRVKEIEAFYVETKINPGKRVLPKCTPFFLLPEVLLFFH